jgi:hypothetical protein
VGLKINDFFVPAGPGRKGGRGKRVVCLVTGNLMDRFPQCTAAITIAIACLSIIRCDYLLIVLLEPSRLPQIMADDLAVELRTALDVDWPVEEYREGWRRLRSRGHGNDERYHATNLTNASQALIYGVIPGPRQGARTGNYPVAFATKIFEHCFCYAGPSAIGDRFVILVLGVVAEGGELRSTNRRYCCATCWCVTSIYFQEVLPASFPDWNKTCYSKNLYDWKMERPSSVPAARQQALLRASSSSAGLAMDITRAIEQAIVNAQQKGQNRDFEIESRRVNIPTPPASAITISREMANTIADTLGRAEQTAAKGAAIAESAAAAFREEADNLRRLKAYIDNKLR